MRKGCVGKICVILCRLFAVLRTSQYKITGGRTPDIAFFLFLKADRREFEEYNTRKGNNSAVPVTVLSSRRTNTKKNTGGAVMHKILRTHFPFLGERAASESELIDFCRDRLTLIYSDIPTGCYVRPKKDLNDHYIFIGNNDSGLRRLVLAHEIGHYLAHSQSTNPTQETEREAKLAERLLIGDFAVS